MNITSLTCVYFLYSLYILGGDLIGLLVYFYVCYEMFVFYVILGSEKLRSLKRVHSIMLRYAMQLHFRYMESKIKDKSIFD